MFFGMNERGARIAIENAESDKEYFCPICGGELVQKHGSARIDHFAHKSGIDCDDWSHDMSEWHRFWQGLFPEEMREVVIEHDGVKHRADAKLFDTIVEFQNSPISCAEFDERNQFYVDAGFKVIWLFNYIEEYHAGKMSDDLKENSFRWKWAPHTFEHFNPKNRKVQVFFQLCHFTEEDAGIITKVVWVAPDAGMKYFVVDEHWLSETEFIDDVKGQTLPELWESFRNIRSGVFVNQVNGYQFFITRSPAFMRKTGEVIGRVMKDGRVSGDERVIYYWNMPQWKAKSVYFYM